MSKAIANYKQEEQRAIIARRLAGNTFGAGYWAARDAADKLKLNIPQARPKTSQKASKTPQDDNQSLVPRKRRQQSEHRNQPFRETLAR